MLDVFLCNPGLYQLGQEISRVIELSVIEQWGHDSVDAFIYLILIVYLSFHLFLTIHLFQVVAS